MSHKTWNIDKKSRNNLTLYSPEGDAYKGSGMLIFTNDKVILFEDRASCQDSGGKLDKHLADGSLLLVKNAMNEAYEESAKTLNFSKVNFDKLEFIDIFHKDSYYRCYLICIDEIYDIAKIFRKNRKILVGQKAEYGFLEMNRVRLIEFNKLKKCAKENKGSEKYKICDDLIIRLRTCQIINKITDELYQKVLKKSYKLKSTVYGDSIETFQ